VKKIQIKRVFLVDEAHNYMVLPQDYIGTLTDAAILDSLYQLGRDVWIGNELYHIVHQDGQIRHLRYEVTLVTQYEKSWYNLLLDAVRRI